MSWVTWKKIWNWHLWLGISVLAPLVFWLGTAMVFALWPIETVRGKSLSTGQSRPPEVFKRGMSLPPEAVEGALHVALKVVEGHPIAMVDRGAATEVWDLSEKRSLGPVLPLAWVREVARRDFKGSADEEAVYLFMRTGPGQRIAGNGPVTLDLASEYAGPRPVYAFHLRKASMHLYVDALTGDLRARRRGFWRFYDLAFRLHSLEFLPDGMKRLLMTAVIALGLVLSVTGLAMAVKRLRRVR
jgi:hypothetical protein